MKLNFGKRFALILHWLGSVIALAALVFNARALELVQTVQNRIGEKYTHMALIALAAVYAFLCILALCILLRPSSKRSERGFITVDSSDTGRVRIAVSAIEQMVKQAVGAIGGIAEMKISISSEDDAIAIVVNVSIVAGTHVPTVTLNIQRAIRQFVEMNCGVAVRSVSISINGVTNAGEPSKRWKRQKGEPAQPVPAPAAPEPQAPANDRAADEIPEVRPISLTLERTPAYDDVPAKPEEAPAADDAQAFGASQGSAFGYDSEPVERMGGDDVGSENLVDGQTPVFGYDSVPEPDSEMSRLDSDVE